MIVSNQDQRPIIIQNNTSNAAGIASFVFGLISLFFLAPLFVPLAILLGTIGIINKQLTWSILGIICAFFGFLTSPILLGLVGVASIAGSQSHSVMQQPLSQQQSERIKKAGEETKEALEKCKNKRLTGELKTYVESAKCSNPQFIEAYRSANYPYMDLIDLIAAKKLEVAEKLDKNELTEAQAQLELAKFMTQITDKERQRNKAGH